MILRTALDSWTTSWPPTLAVPPSGRSRVARMRTTVVLPAPFGPSRPNTVPCRTARSTPSSAVVLPYRFTRPSARIAYVVEFMTPTVAARADTARTPRCHATCAGVRLQAHGSGVRPGRRLMGAAQGRAARPGGPAPQPFERTLAAAAQPEGGPQPLDREDG